MMTTEQIEAIQKEALENNGHCSKCTQTIKIYRYPVNQATALFMRAMATKIVGTKEDPGTGVNDVDISTIGLPYSVRTQVSKIRQHGLIARITDENGHQIPSRWLVTKKGWSFLNGKPISGRVIVFDNNVLGHDDSVVTIHGVLGEQRNKSEPLYVDVPVSEPEARVYGAVREKPKRKMEVTAQFRGMRYSNIFNKVESYQLTIDRLAMGHPVKLMAHSTKADVEFEYKDIAAFQREWKVLT